MNCNYHPNQEAEALCVKCKNPICQECTIKVEDKTICRHCLERSLSFNSGPNLAPEIIPKNTFIEKFLFLCYSLIPGAAHMHLGLFRRGTQLLIITFGGLALINFIGLNFIIPFIVIPAWFFSFFESHHLRRRVEKGQTIVDQDLFDRQLFDYTPLLKNHRLIGATIIILGLLSFIHQLDRYSFIRNLIGNWDLYNLLRGSIVPLMLILGGIYLILRTSRPQKMLDLTSDIPKVFDKE
ncbi:B-box zinc finger protein [Desulfosporosinus meridiei]|uniref:B-box zinc finger n=1 Tax=Desulfosporosinus meridiei (strain ATCC BAA-275 / DSM 13257 / KCTC 12902 / NCIMB 13706 / S10) TaxID=768704 RepID=J7IMT7_DESMD|nr:B-box zinc finger protein [Desulfosporosinus meridiei]AFQ42880.1 B-box zinc finger [Desulfosporosinus meridiei DSM 13257]